ncbi:PaaI family thioesterase [Thioalkalivibrio sp. HK1]|uniref:PaaI family thioesterase n=1 Tax=Thioalkalivibrio sp. HK1 TaxID=1469245 RepID=UPI0004717E10|nr:PaaI family thioesterase [Thioalkalivibrio sp. HK1]
MSETITPEKIEEMLAKASFHRFCEPKVISLDESAGTLTLKVPMRDEFERVTGSKQWHGGVMAAVVDIAGDLALAIVYGGPLPTINLRIDYLRPAIDTDLTAIGKVRRAGRTIGVVDVDVIDDRGEVVAIGRGCYSSKVG